MTYPLSILQKIIPNTGISVTSASDMTAILVFKDVVKIDVGYDEKIDDLIYIPASNKEYPLIFFLDLIFNPENEFYDL